MKTIKNIMSLAADKMLLTKLKLQESGRLKEWFVEFVISTVNKTMNDADKEEITKWFEKVKGILANQTLAKSEQIKAVYENVESTKIVRILFNSLGETLKNYKNSDLPTPVKVALPVALAGLTFLGGQGIGLAAFGGAIGAPVVLVIFIGTAGVTAIIEGLIKSNNKNEIALLLCKIADNEIFRRKEKALKDALKESLTIPKKITFDPEELNLKEKLQSMEPFDFERHVMSFFPGDKVGVTPSTNDYGIDGWCEYKSKLIVVQCKRNSDQNKVGRPNIQAFKGAIGDNKGDIGVFVTTSTFTDQAIECAKLSENFILIDVTRLIEWHNKGFDIVF